MPQELTKDEIKQYVEWLATGANNAMPAGFDGVKAHAANGYIVDRFLQGVTNNRTEACGGSIPNRTRFALEVMDAVVNAVGPTKVRSGS